MASPLPLLHVKLALPPEIKALPHVYHRINELLLPTTVDAAVFNELHRLVRVYRPFRPWTVGAMDGAAVRGRLHILQRLQSTRTEGCSSAAFIGAAANGHLDVLRWLHRHYRSLRDFGAEASAAVEHGHLQVLEFLHPSLDDDELESAMVAAATHGHVQILEFLQPQDVHLLQLFLVAAANGQVQVLQFLMKIREISVSFRFEGLRKAAEQGQCAVVELLLGTSQPFEETSDHLEISGLLGAAAAAGQFDVMRLLLEQYDPDERVVASGFQLAKNFNMLKLFLEYCPSRMPADLSVDDEASWRALHPAQKQIDNQFMRAAEEGLVDTVKLLFNRVAIPVSNILMRIAICNQLPVMEAVLEL